jgi:hypothetical protein
LNTSAFTDPIAQSALALWLHSGWVFPIVESVHIVSFALLVGGIGVLDARLIGLLRHTTVEPLMRSVLPVAFAGFVGAVLSGLLLFVAGAGELLGNRAFVTKIALLMLAGLNAAWFHAGAARAALVSTGPPTGRMRAAGLLSMLLWIGVIFAGRLIAYV